MFNFYSKSTYIIGYGLAGKSNLGRGDFYQLQPNNEEEYSLFVSSRRFLSALDFRVTF